MKCQSVFTPNDVPTITYVDRADHRLERVLKEYFDTPNMVVSISGPSKSGKTVLVKKVVAEDCLITIRGTSLTSGEALWDRVLDWMDVPSLSSEGVSTGASLSGGIEAGGRAGIPVVLEGKAKPSASVGGSMQKTTTKTFNRGGLEQVIKEIGGSEFVVFIDDFHYIPENIRDDIGRQIKVAAENGIKIFTASVPHKTDDVVRSNSELRGRVVSLNIEPWSVDDLVQIAKKGFYALNIDLSPLVENRLAQESFGSPQLMQSICLNLAFAIGAKTKLEKHVRVEVAEDQISESLERTSAFADFSKMLRDLHTGAKTRGTERKEHKLIDGTQGDVYRAVLLAIKQNPGVLSFSYDEIISRVKSVCVDEPPAGSSINSALSQMQVIAEGLQPNDSPIAWDDTNLDIADPYFLFFLRCSDKLDQIGK